MSGESENSEKPTDSDQQLEPETAEDVTNNPPPPLSTTMLFEILANKRRRYVFHSLKENETPIALADLADEVAIRETETSSSEIPAEEVKRIHTSLWHSHIPKLADVDIIEYNQDRETVALAANAEQLEPTWSRFFQDNFSEA